MNEKTILLVEDNPDDEELTLMALKQSQIMHRVVVAHDGVEALEYLFGDGKPSALPRHDFPQVILLDLKLPKMGGLDVLKRVRTDSRTQFLPVVILTSSNEDEDVLSSYRMGANSYVCKPVAFQQFKDAIQQLGIYWMLFNQALPLG